MKLQAYMWVFYVCKCHVGTNSSGIYKCTEPVENLGLTLQTLMYGISVKLFKCLFADPYPDLDMQVCNLYTYSLAICM